MSSTSSISSTKQHPVLRVKPLSISSSNPVSGKLHDINKIVTMQNAQAVANTKYDPDPPVPPSNPVFIEQFQLMSTLSQINWNNISFLFAGTGLFCILFSQYLSK